MVLKSRLRVGAAQYPFDEFSELSDWEGKISEWVRRGAEDGGELLVFPEYGAIEQAAIFGRQVTDDVEATLLHVADLAQERVAFHAELAAKFNVHILVGSGPAKDQDGKIYNCAQLVSPKGVIGEQRKMVLTPFEQESGLQASDVLNVFDTNLGRIGIAICYDSEFPLLVRAMAAAGVELLLVPACTERLSGHNRLRTASMARALENSIAVVHAATVGDAKWSPVVDHNVGAAGVFVPAELGLSDDGVLACGELNVSGWVTCDIDIARLRALRHSGEMRNFEDWPRQPGGQLSLPKPKVVSLK